MPVLLADSAQGVYCQTKLKIDPAKLNPRGGAVALGHPLGCTGARQIVTALSELKRTGKKIAITSMCVGTVSKRSTIGHPRAHTDSTSGNWHGRINSFGTVTAEFHHGLPEMGAE